MSQTCRACQRGFDVAEEDLAFYDKVSPVFNGKKVALPPPTLCPDCRHQRRGALHPKQNFYRRNSDFSGKELISMYKPSELKVYADAEWWGDTWDAKQFGRDIDFSRPFFDQFRELYHAVPKQSNSSAKGENCDYSCRTTNSKSVYYSFSVHSCEQVYYCNHVTNHCEYVMDCDECFQSTRLYECFSCFHCSDSSYLVRCKDTRDAYFSVDCNGCNDIIFCSNLRNKGYHIFNKPVSKEEFAKAKEALINGSYANLQDRLAKFKEVQMQAIYNQLNKNNAEDCTGDDLTNCKNCHECYNCINTVDGRYLWDLGPKTKNADSMDMTKGGVGELLYECAGMGGGNYHMLMSALCRSCSFLTYCIECFDSQNCFGCTGLRKAEYCILNKQYTKEEYEILVPRLIEHMSQRIQNSESGIQEIQPRVESSSPEFQILTSGFYSEWGEFFDPKVSAFGYNETIAVEYFPLTREDAMAKGFQWSDYVPPPPVVDKTVAAARIPDNIDQVPDEILNWAIECEVTGRPFRIIKQELQWYRDNRLPLPRKHPDIRHMERIAYRNPRTLFDRTCGKCSKAIKSTYAPTRPEKVFCEECYLGEVY